MSQRDLKLSELLRTVKIIRISGELAVRVQAIRCDSREIQPGDLFVALRGEKVDGNRFIRHAVAAGAAVVISELPDSNLDVAHVQVADARKALAEVAAAYHGRPAEEMSLIGITGTNGKTTTAHLTRAILEAAGYRTGLIGTVTYAFCKESIPASLTTPAPLQLHALLARMHAAGCRHVVMEVTSHGLAQKRTHGLHFQRAVFCNFSHDHLDFHGNTEAYFAAKKKLFEELHSEDMAILNADDQRSAQIAAAAKARIVRFGAHQSAEIRGEVLKSDLTGLDVKLSLDDANVRLHSPLLGAFNLHNILAAAAVAKSVGVDPTAIARGTASLRSVAGRMESVSGPQPFHVLVDFAHTPAALRSLLEDVRRLGTGRIILVFGCGGERDRSKRPEMGRIADQLADEIIVTSDNPRSEDPEEIIQQIDAGIAAKTKRSIIVDRRLAIAEAQDRAQANDVVIVAGRGHEPVQEWSNRQIPFDDRAVVRELLAEKFHADKISKKSHSPRRRT